MGSLHSRVQPVANRLRTLIDRPLESACYELLSPLYPDLIWTKRKGFRSLQNLGIDLYVPGKDPNHLAFAVQIKGSEGPGFAGDLEQRCMRDIEKTGTSGLVIDKYWLFTNQKPDHKAEGATYSRINNALAVIRQLCRADALFLPGNRLPEEILRMAEGPARAALKLVGTRALASFERRFGEQYVPEVPAEVRTADSTRDVVGVVGELEQLVAGSQYDKPSIHMIVSTYGFGKTHTLLRLARSLPETRTAFYVQLSQLSGTRLANASELALQIVERAAKDTELLENVVPTKEEAFLREFPEDMRSAIITQAIKRNPDLILLVDGVDEHRSAYGTRIIELVRFLQSLRGLWGHVIIACREEYLVEHASWLEAELSVPGLWTSKALLAAHPKVRIDTVVRLAEWGNAPLRAFMQGLPAFVSGSPGVQLLGTRIEQGNYDRYYGTIPRRPLFLNLLVEALTGSEDAAPALLDIYRLGILQKIRRDLVGHTGKETIDRGLPDANISEIQRNIYRALILVGACPEAHGDRDPNIRLSFVFDRFYSLARQHLGDAVVPREWLLRCSVIVPMQASRFGDELRFQFSHLSFQDLFLAEYAAGSLQSLGVQGKAGSPTRERERHSELGRLFLTQIAEDQAKQ